MPTPNNQAEILYTNFVKYDALNHHIKGYMLNRVKEKPEIVNVYIDLYQMLTYLFLNEYIEDPINIASCLINHAIHYRNYFRRYCDIPMCSWFIRQLGLHIVKNSAQNGILQVSIEKK